MFKKVNIAEEDLIGADTINQKSFENFSSEVFTNEQSSQNSGLD